MITPPKRSVTRFFIPLIDVLILLFCIFLLMPYVKPVEGEPAPTPAPTPAAIDQMALRQEIELLKRDRDRLINERDRAVRRLSIRVLDIDRDTGKLYDYAPGRKEIASQADALAVIGRERRAAIGRETYFLLMFPRDPSGYPLQRQVAAYDRWFADVPHGFDNPHGRK